MSPVQGERKDRALAEQLSGAFVIFGALAVGGLLATALTYGFDWAILAPDVERSQLAVRAESDGLGAILSEEIALRRYLTTRDVQFKQAYARVEERRERANKALTAVIAPISGLALAMVDERLAEERWREKWARAAFATAPSAVSPPVAEGEARFDAYLSAQSLFARALDDSSDAARRHEKQLVAARMTLHFVVFLMIAILAVRQRRALHEWIVEPILVLLRNIRRIRDGQLETAADSIGPRELCQLGQGLNDMVQALSAAGQAAASRDQALRDHSVRLRQILDASREFSESLNLLYVVRAVRASTAAIGGYERVTVWLMDDDQKQLVDGEVGVNVAPSDALIDMKSSLAGRAAKSGRITFENSAGQSRFSDSDIGMVRAIAMPLIVGARVVGALEARTADARSVTREAVDVLEMIATHAATAIESARLHEVVEERSQVDALTRLMNRRCLDADLDIECKRSLRYARPLSFVMLDVDHFKAFNDSHGHPMADKALQAVADTMTRCMRTTDTAYRYGGEEFCVILRETNGLDGMHFAERVRQRIQERFANGEMAGLTASFGVADFSADRPTPHELILAADAAMYESKHGGRNRVVLSPEPLFALNGEFETRADISVAPPSEDHCGRPSGVVPAQAGVRHGAGETSTTPELAVPATA